MVEQVIIIVIVGLVSAFLGAMLALRFQRGYWKNIHAGQDGWENAQKSHHRNWEEKQEKLIAEAETKFTTQVQQLHRQWQQWETRDAERIAEHIRQQERSGEQARIERELARLPRIEETSMVLESKQTTGSLSSPHWRPATLQGADLSGLDLSHRYLGRADLRNAQLSRTNFFMADLSGACLADANLTEADLSGANLSNADLRGAILSSANLLVADLNNAILTGASLRNARNLTPQQIYTTFYDSTTSLDEDIDITQSRTSSMLHSSKEAPSMLPHSKDVSSDNIDHLENNELTSDHMFEETMPTLAIIKPETSQSISDPGDNLNVLDEQAHPETSFAVTDSTENVNEFSQETMDTEEDVVPFSPIDPATSDELAPSDQEIHLLSENQHSKQPEKIVTPLRKTKRHGRKRAKVG